jgi:transposase-like protein
MVTYETVRKWCRKFGPEYARRLKRRQGRLDDEWRLDELFVNNRVEVSHEPTRQPERGMRRFKSMTQSQRFLSVHGITQNLFRVGRHLLRAAN